jgi:hypothetical protein
LVGHRKGGRSRGRPKGKLQEEGEHAKKEKMIQNMLAMGYVVNHLTAEDCCWGTLCALYVVCDAHSEEMRQFVGNGKWQVI